MIDVLWSMILGCSLAALLFYIFNDNVIYKGPNSKDIKSKIYKISRDNKCYVLQPKIYLCPNKSLK